MGRGCQYGFRFYILVKCETQLESPDISIHVSTYPLSLVLIGFVGVGQMVQMALGNTLIQYYSDPVYLGRLMSIMMMQFGLMSFSTFVAGALTELTGNVQWAIGGLALILVVLSVSAIIFVKRIRDLE